MRSEQARVLEAVVVWDVVYGRMYATISELEMLEILGPVRALSVDGRTLWVSVPTEWHRFQLLNGPLGRTLAYAVSQELGEGGTLGVRVAPEL